MTAPDNLKYAIVLDGEPIAWVCDAEAGALYLNQLPENLFARVRLLKREEVPVTPPLVGAFLAIRDLKRGIVEIIPMLNELLYLYPKGRDRDVLMEHPEAQEYFRVIASWMAERCNASHPEHEAFMQVTRNRRISPAGEKAFRCHSCQRQVLSAYEKPHCTFCGSGILTLLPV